MEWADIMWSDPAPGDFDSQRTAQDLHNALMNAGEQTPWIMVGHSLGGPHIMIFNSLYESEIAGFVFVDASHPEQNDRFRKIKGNATDDEPKIAKIPPLLADMAARIGIVRLLPLGLAPGNAPSFVNPEEFKKAGHHKFVESSHNIQFNRPKMVIKAVNEVVSIARKK